MILDRSIDFMDSLSRGLGRLVSWGVLAMTVVMTAVVVLRYFIGEGSIALQESVLYFHSLVFLLGLAWTLADDQHVRVDIFYQRWSVQARAWIDIAGVVFLLLPTCLVIFVGSLDYVADSWSVHEGSRESGGLPFIYLLKTLIPVAMLFLSLQGLALLLKSLRQLRSTA